LAAPPRTKTCPKGPVAGVPNGISERMEKKLGRKFATPMISKQARGKHCKGMEGLVAEAKAHVA